MKEVSAFFESKGIDDAAKEAEILIAETLHLNKSKLYTGSTAISGETSTQIDFLAARRAQGEPLQYIIGHVEFYGLKINVGPGVLIPRPETELLVEETIKLITPLLHHSITILDLCTGSGCIAIALAKHFPDAVVYGIDASNIAMEYAIKNAAENDIRNVRFIKGDLFRISWDSPESTTPIGVRNSGTVPMFTVHCFDCIVSNPPYIRKGDIPNLQREVKDHEPLEALDGGEDGLDFYRKIAENAPKFLKENGIIILEIGHDQAEDVNEIAVSYGIKNISFIKDYAGIRRIFSGEI
ncbi:MAG: protein-(glutamine-N5) methyltransferase, release factor-specific [Nitrospirae bacterium GWC2_46_6]|nr:MAG: protein-(glutamine-N5) methyltransferase, release factor-specific [Nitrospirae bacterium GWA2_46_11]OGW19987.1 MAG: protein-(glutamine-N5) methyltransferase, release factor-specific [Nitrospirae bacterium GWC2_46_6]OGW24560.1 MAG: protein-(glutamine-N5) methyltransferase, release factor-specific [Nitrospirae bacterium GWB2_47_37]